MKNMRRTGIILVMLLAFSVLMFACTRQNISLLATLNMEPGDTYLLTPETNVSNLRELNWTSSNPNVATVDEDGLLTAIEEGTTVITVSVGNISASCTLIVARSQTSILREAKDNAIAELNEHFEGFSESDYYLEQWAALVAAYNSAYGSINSAYSIGAVQTFLNMGIAAIDEVLTLVEVNAAAREAAINALNQFMQTTLEENYFGAEWTAIQELFSNALTDIAAAGTVTEINEIKNSAIDAIGAVKTIETFVSEAKEAAVKVLDDIMQAITPVSGTRYIYEEYYYAADWVKMLEFYGNGKNAIEAAAGLSDVSSALATAIANLNGINRMAIEDYAEYLIYYMYDYLEALQDHFSAYIYSNLLDYVTDQSLAFMDVNTFEEYKAIKDETIRSINEDAIRIIDEILGYKGNIDLSELDFPGWDLDYLDEQYITAADLFAMLKLGVNDFDDNYYNALIHFMTRAFINFDSRNYFVKVFPTEFPEIYATMVTLFQRIDDEATLMDATVGAIWWDWAWSVELFQFIMNAYPGLDASEALAILTTFMYNPSAIAEFNSLFYGMDFTEILAADAAEFGSVFATFMQHYKNAFWNIDWVEDMFITFTYDLKGGELFGSTENVILKLRVRNIDIGLGLPLEEEYWIWDQWSTDFLRFFDIYENAVPTKGDIEFLGWRRSNGTVIADLANFLYYLASGEEEACIIALWDEKPAPTVDPRLVGTWKGTVYGSEMILIINADGTCSRNLFGSTMLGYLRDNGDGTFELMPNDTSYNPFGTIKLNANGTLYYKVSVIEAECVKVS